jgi:hypothetical protein
LGFHVVHQAVSIGDRGCMCLVELPAASNDDAMRHSI